METNITQNQSSQVKGSFWQRRSLLIVLIFAVFVILYAALDYFGAALPPYMLKKNASSYEWRKYGENLIERKRYASAEKAIKKALSIDPGEYKAHTDLGAIYYAQGDFIKSMPYFEKTAAAAKDKDKSNYKVAIYDLAKSYLCERKPEEAWGLLTEAYKMRDASDAGMWNNDPNDPASQILVSDKRKFIEQVNNFYPNEMASRLDRIIRYTHFFLPQKALDDCHLYLKENPGSRFTSDILLYEAWVLGKLKKYKECLAVLDSLKYESYSETQRSDILYYRYDCYSHLDQYSQALAVLEEMQAKHPKDYSVPWVKYKQSLLFRDSRDYDAEKKVLRETLIDYPNYSSFYDLSSRLLEIYSVKREYIEGYNELVGMSRRGIFVQMVLLSIILSGVCCLLFFVFFRIFFFKRVEEMKNSPYRIRDLWLFSILMGLLAPFVEFLLFQLNFSTNNLLFSSISL